MKKVFFWDKHMRSHVVSLWLERVCHLAIIALAVSVAFLLRFDFAVPANALPILDRAVLIAVLVKLPIFELAGFYRSLRRFASIPELNLVFLGNLAGSMLLAGVSMLAIGGEIPRSVLIIDGILCFLGTASLRFSGRIAAHTFRSRPAPHKKGILIYGAGRAGVQLVREIQSSRRTKYVVQGFLDDDPIKRHARVLGIAVLGAGREALSVVQRLDRGRERVAEIIIAAPSATGPQMRELLANCRSAGVPCKTLPGIDELLGGRVLYSQVRRPSLQDLLGRQQLRLDETEVRRSITGHSVLVTGAAGSIGSEICRQVARFRPACLIALDQAESDLFRLEAELREAYPHLELAPALANIREADSVAEVLRRYHVESIFHAAAYKHVPMMESQIVEAFRNNIIGTFNLVRTAQAAGARRLVMISSDKAVNPICVMGATKRACERMVSARWEANGHTRFAAVRFGNVLGSNASVVPIFQSQIEAGGPVKVTHPDVRRYFMTVAEAVSLVLQASTKGDDGEIFILDMGEPVRIIDLAENMIRLAGKVPHEEIEIQFTGLRPGEKLTEDIRSEGEGAIRVTEKLYVIKERPLSGSTIETWMEELQKLVATRHEEQLIRHLQKLVPEFSPQAERRQVQFHADNRKSRVSLGTRLVPREPLSLDHGFKATPSA